MGRPDGTARVFRDEVPPVSHPITPPSLLRNGTLRDHEFNRRHLSST
jgi:hypothetical protein